MRLAGALAALALAAAVGCSSEAETFSIRLVFAPGAPQACPHPPGAAPSCATVPMSCDARVRIRITDASGANQLYARCYRLERPNDACALRDVPLEASLPLVNEMARVQVMVWSEDQIAALADRLADDGCPVTVPFDAFGRPKLGDSALVPALGGESYFPVGLRRVAEVELGCPRYDLLDTAACRAGTPDIVATVRQVTPWSFLEDVPPSMQVRFATPFQDGEGVWQMPSGIALVPSGGADRRWTAPLEGELPALACIEIDGDEVGAAKTVTCRDVTVSGGVIAAEGVAVFLDRQRDLVRLIGQAGFPVEGLVLGIILEANGLPAAGARIRSPEGVLYPSADFTRIDEPATTSTGLFVSTTAGFATAWHAEGVGGIGDDGSARGGLLGNRLSVVVVRLNPRVPGPAMDGGL